MKPRSYDDLKAAIEEMTTEAQKKFSKGKYWLTLEENNGTDYYIITDGDEEEVAMGVLICREKGKTISKKVKKGMNGKSRGTTTTGSYQCLAIPVLKDEIPDVIQLMIEDDNLFIEEGDRKEEAGNISYWCDVRDGKVHIKMGYDRETDMFFVEGSNLKEQTA